MLLSIKIVTVNQFLFVNLDGTTCFNFIYVYVVV